MLFIFARARLYPTYDTHRALLSRCFLLIRVRETIQAIRICLILSLHYCIVIYNYLLLFDSSLLRTLSTMSIEPKFDSNPWADSPFALIPTPFGPSLPKDAHFAHYMAHNMVHIHNMILRSFNAIYNQAPFLSCPTDITDFLRFCSLAIAALHHHHTTEEAIFFPQIESLVGKPGCMDSNVQQHRQFEAGLDAFAHYIDTCTPESYSASTLRQHLDSFGPILATHLADEIPTLQALDNQDPKKLRQIWHAAGRHSKSSAPAGDMLPMMIGSHDVTYEGGAQSEFNTPWFLRIVNNLFLSRQHKAAWRFLPCDANSMPRHLSCGPLS